MKFLINRNFSNTEKKLNWKVNYQKDKHRNLREHLIKMFFDRLNYVTVDVYTLFLTSVLTFDVDNNH